MVAGADTEVGTVAKNSTERVAVTLSTYKGKRRCDRRTQWDAGNSDWRNTAKGINLPVDSLPELYQLIEEAMRQEGIDPEGQAE